MHNIEVWLRSRAINGDALLLRDPDRAGAPELRWLLEGPLKILQIEPDGSYVLASTFSDAFERGDILYLPEMQDGRPLTVFHPKVLLKLQAEGNPFALKADPAKANDEPGYPPSMAPDFDPRHPAYVVGLYDGGGTYNSRVYRPSGSCKMRDSGRVEIVEKDVTVDPDRGRIVGSPTPRTKFVPFCYVCRYVIVNTLDPTLLEGLEYPA
jgi:hypothetical protein